MIAHSMGEHARYRKQDGVNVMVVAEEIADKQEVSDIESNLFKQLYDRPTSGESPLRKAHIKLAAKTKHNETKYGFTGQIKSYLMVEVVYLYTSMAWS